MRLLVIILSTFMVLGCAMQPQLDAVVKPKVEAPALTLDQIAFRAAITNAVAVSPALVYDKLFPINDTNPALAWKGPPEKRMLKVVSLMRQGAYDKYFKGKTKGRSDPGHPNWVTAAPQVQRFCQGIGLTGKALSDRLKEWIGLAPESPYDVFVELWVDPADLLRPCPDPQIDDTRCDIAFGMRDGMPVNPPVKGLKSYRAFFDQLYLTAYKPGGAPWTRLGYTYDWNPQTPIYGASEYIITPGATFTIAGATPIAEYCKP